ncbi:MAG: hypothetical protein JSW03_03000 [Candidatus Eiseniibacteriota bacterium]|nr:MAG: hypothetical protein JSW03_03000 [Candidatus Eisenbacteria bacterium]
MRTLYLCAVLVLAVATLAVVTGCEGPTGPRGAPGESGAAECFACHFENSELLAIEAQWAASVHATGGNFERNGSSCAGCHTHEGFLAQLATGSSGSPTNPSPIHCFTCHEPHTSGDFHLRTQAPVTLTTGGVFDMGHGNLCANCHQSRQHSPLVAAAPESTSVSGRWGPHHGPQSNMLSGNGGYEFSGYTYGDSPHTRVVSNGCPSCHMADPYGAQAGGHTMSMEYEYHEEETPNVAGCNTQDCHRGAVEDFNYNFAQVEVEALMEDLFTALQQRGVIDSEGSVVSGKYPEAEAGAYFNYKFIEEDRSHGIHNTQYTKALLYSSLAELGVPAPVASR